MPTARASCAHPRFDSAAAGPAAASRGGTDNAGPIVESRRVFSAFVVTLREIAELLLIAESARLCLLQQQRAALLLQLALGLAAGLLAGATFGIWAAAGGLGARGQALITLVFALTMVSVTTTALFSRSAILRHVQDSAAGWTQAKSTPLLVFVFAAFVGFRESAEIVIFLSAVQRRSGLSDALAGAALGTVAAALLTMAYRRLSMRVNLLRLFQLSALVMVALCVKLLIDAVGHLLSAQFAADSVWITASAPFLEGGRWHAALCAALMAVPMLALLRRWWFEAERV